MKTIWKFHLPIRDEVSIDMPKGAVILRVGAGPDNPFAEGEIYLWAMVDPLAPASRRMFRVFGTGHPIDDVSVAYDRYLGTVVQGSFVWHVFEV